MGKLTGKLIEIPFAFLGMGLFRVWTETVYSNGLLAFPSQSSIFTGFAAYNTVAAVALIVLALLAKRIITFYGRRWAMPVTGLLLVASTCLTFGSLYAPQLALVLGVPAVLCGGVGIALIIALWSELLGCLSPFRAGLYFSGGLVLGAMVLWLFKGLATPWLWVCTCLAPIISLECLRRSYLHLEDGARPHATWGKHQFPWKPIAIVALYSFAYGLCENVFGDVLGIHSGLGCVAAALLVYFGICFRGEHFSFTMIYKAACPLLIVSLFPFAFFIDGGGSISAFFALAGYTLSLIAIMVILSNLCYQFGCNAIWLFCIERAVRLVSVQVGIEVNAFVGANIEMSVAQYLILAAVVAAMILAATYLFLTEVRITSDWGTILRDAAEDDTAPNQHVLLGRRCNQISQTFKLTSKEETILLMLLKGMKPAQIEAELFVAASTVKTHTKHIYQKLDAHSRKELLDLVGVAGQDAED